MTKEEEWEEEWEEEREWEEECENLAEFMLRTAGIRDDPVAMLQWFREWREEEEGYF